MRQSADQKGRRFGMICADELQTISSNGRDAFFIARLPDASDAVAVADYNHRSAAPGEREV